MHYAREVEDAIDQGFPTCGPRSKSGPPASKSGHRPIKIKRKICQKLQKLTVLQDISLLK